MAYSQQNDLVLVNPNIYKSDHIFPSYGHLSLRFTAILYGQIGTNGFHELHEYLKELRKRV